MDEELKLLLAQGFVRSDDEEEIKAMQKDAEDCGLTLKQFLRETNPYLAELVNKGVISIVKNHENEQTTPARHD